MPAKLTASLAREWDEPHDGLRQASIRVEMDVDPGLVGRPRHFRKRLEQILALARTALADEGNNVASMAQRLPLRHLHFLGQPNSGGEEPRD
jgi:hypothetical protein